MSDNRIIQARERLGERRKEGSRFAWHTIAAFSFVKKAPKNQMRLDKVDGGLQIFYCLAGVALPN